jgi:lysophospholipase L1-like esterase
MIDINLKRYREEAIKKAEAKREGKILFYGSSTFARWETLEEDLLPYDAVNNGFGGSTAEEALYYYYLLVRPFNPSAIVYYEGDNDLVDEYSPLQILERIAQFFKWVSTDFPCIPMYIVLVKHSPARHNLWAERKSLNDMIVQYAEKNGINIIDLNKVALDEKCQYNMKYFEDDGLHLNRDGNLLLAKLIKDVFAHTLPPERI